MDVESGPATDEPLPSSSALCSPSTDSSSPSSGSAAANLTEGSSTDEEEGVGPQSSTTTTTSLRLAGLDCSSGESGNTSSLESSSLNVSSVNVDAVLASAAAMYFDDVGLSWHCEMPALQDLQRGLAMKTAEVRRLEAERDSLVEELGKERAVGERAQRMEAEAQRQLQEYKMDSETTLSSLQSRVQTLTESLRLSEERCAELEGHGMRYKALNDDVRRLTKELEEARETSSTSAASLHKLAAEMSSQAEALSQAQAERDLARRDRDAMERQVKHLEMECERKDRHGWDVEALETKLSVVKAKKKELAAAMERDNSTMVAEAQRKVDTEIRRLTEKQQAEVVAMKQGLVELHSREIDGLRAQLDMAEAARLQALRRTEELEATCDELKVAHSRSAAALQRDLVEAQGMLQLQRFETDRATNLAEDRGAVVEELQQECKVLRGKVELLRTELDERRASGAEELSSVRGEMAVLKERLGAYEKMEEDMTMAVQAAISLESSCTPSGDTGGNDAVISEVLGSIPVTSRRRVKENLLLTRRLQDLTAELATYKRKYEEAHREAEALRDELAASAKRLGEASRPQQYIAESLKSRDLEIAEHRAKLRESEQEVSRLHEELEASREKVAEVEGDIRRLLALRSKHSQKHSTKSTAQGGSRSLASTIATLRSTMPIDIGHKSPRYPVLSYRSEPNLGTGDTRAGVEDVSLCFIPKLGTQFRSTRMKRAHEVPDASKVFGPQLLSMYDGETTGEVYVALKGIVYDVTHRRDLYGPGGRYHLFAGKDATRAFALMSFKPEDIENSRSTEGFGDENWQALQEWVDKYEKYDKVGVLVYPDGSDTGESLEHGAEESTESRYDADAEDSAETASAEASHPVARRKLKVDRRKVGHMESIAAQDSRRALEETGISVGGMLGQEAEDAAD
ncbi:hypothetical protein FOZ60_014422 [Perkinsus olseni]|uniref:Cytochrome b5 heme-binding domain-containing protein n=1 Tax=Perkinsus olseni TaxID=32597 RepID=A0A7J6P701_PEROL|nr:hypothetical protein FOZ60_014422 [Perkinsus olseni]